MSAASRGAEAHPGQVVADMIDAGRSNPDTATMARVSMWAVEGIDPGTHIYKIHVRLPGRNVRRSWGYCEGTPFYNVPHDPTPGADFCLPLSEAVRRFVAKPSLPFLGLIGFRVVCSREGEALFHRSVQRYAEMLEGAGRHDLAADLRAVKVEKRP